MIFLHTAMLFHGKESGSDPVFLCVRVGVRVRSRYPTTAGAPTRTRTPTPISIRPQTSKAETAEHQALIFPAPGIRGQLDLSVAFGADLPPYRPAPDASRNPRFQHLNNDLMSHLPRQPLDLGLQSFNTTGQLTDQHKSHQTKRETKHRHRYHGFTLLFIIDLTKRFSTARIVCVWPFRF